MRHEGQVYYVGLLKAAELHGATRRARHGVSVQFGQAPSKDPRRMRPDRLPLPQGYGSSAGGDRGLQDRYSQDEHLSQGTPTEVSTAESFRRVFTALVDRLSGERARMGTSNRFLDGARHLALGIREADRLMYCFVPSPLLGGEVGRGLAGSTVPVVRILAVSILRVAAIGGIGWPAGLFAVTARWCGGCTGVITAKRRYCRCLEL